MPGSFQAMIRHQRIFVYPGKRGLPGEPELVKERSMGLNYEKEGHIVKVGMNRPKERNALDPQILMDLHQAWKEINADDAIRAVILHSCLSDIFCSGMDLRTAIPILTKMKEPETDAERWLAQWGPHVGEAMLEPNIVKKPVIAAVK